MQGYSIKHARLAAVACLVLAAGTAWAAPDTSSAAPAATAMPAAAATTTASTAEDSSTSTTLGRSVSGQKLDAERGKASTGTSEANLGGVVSGNSASNLPTGSNTIDAGSFANMSGLPVVIQNTGANVMIQSATVINVMFK